LILQPIAQHIAESQRRAYKQSNRQSKPRVLSVAGERGSIFIRDTYLDYRSLKATITQKCASVLATRPYVAARSEKFEVRITVISFFDVTNTIFVRPVVETRVVAIYD
jgi:hypothetical protein